MKKNSSVMVATTLLTCLFALPALAQSTKSEKPHDVTYTADLRPMNALVTSYETTGHARFEIHGDKLSINIDVKGASPDTVHWQHFHGFKATQAASCPTEAADVNGDGVVDLIETEPASGTTMVPFDNMPAAMDVAHGVYPKASAEGSYNYHKVVSVKELSAAFAKAFDGQALNLDTRVLLIHGVPSDMKLPATVQSLGPIPAQVTLPIACGKIERASQ